MIKPLILGLPTINENVNKKEFVAYDAKLTYYKKSLVKNSLTILYRNTIIQYIS